MRNIGLFPGLILAAVLPGVAVANPINPVMEFSAALLTGEKTKAISLIEGPVSQVEGRKFIPVNGLISSGDFLESLNNCRFFQLIDFSSTSDHPAETAVIAEWQCSGVKVSFWIKPSGQKVQITDLQASGLPPPPPARR